MNPVRRVRHRRPRHVPARPGALAGAALALAAAATVLALSTAAGAAPSRPDPVAHTLRTALAGGLISQADFGSYSSTYAAAEHSLRRLAGTRQLELGAVLADAQSMAASGTLTPSRMPSVFLTIERNHRWWTTEPLLADGQRVSFPGSRIVWQYYAGQGLQIQWLGTFGEGNGYYLAGRENAQLRQLLAEVVPLASERAGGISWDYLFQFDGGRPPWTSGLSQGTAIQLLARAWSRFHDPTLLTAAQRALGIFEHRTPLGVRVDEPAGAEYAEYSYAPSDRIINGFVQALVGLYDYASITHDPVGLGLFEAGDAEARREVPHYDTGAWSRYDQHSESNLSYHELLTEFLEHLCARTRDGLPLQTSTTSPAQAPTPGATGGAGTAHKPPPIPGDSIYCTTAARFTKYLSTPPVISLLTKRLRTSTEAGVAVSLSKVSTVSLTIRRKGRVVWTNSATVEAGRPRLLWPTPSRGGTFQVTVAARDLAGNFSTTSGVITVSGH
jgi:hypothetical protein